MLSQLSHLKICTHPAQDEANIMNGGAKASFVEHILKVPLSKKSWEAHRDDVLKITQRAPGTQAKESVYIEKHFPDRWTSNPSHPGKHSHREYVSCRKLYEALTAVPASDIICKCFGYDKSDKSVKSKIHNEPTLSLADEAAKAAQVPVQGEGDGGTSTLLDAFFHYCNRHVVFSTPSLNNSTVYKILHRVVADLFLEPKYHNWQLIDFRLSIITPGT
jgi:hypothetical protein